MPIGQTKNDEDLMNNERGESCLLQRSGTATNQPVAGDRSPEGNNVLMSTLRPLLAHRRAVVSFTMMMKKIKHLLHHHRILILRGGEGAARRLIAAPWLNQYSPPP
jgi:hypothetical protein